MSAARTVRKSFDRAIVEGPIGRAVWMLAWPTILQNLFGGLQGMVDHIMVGHFVGYTGNAAIGISLQIYLVLIVFVSSLFGGMSVLVARFAGAGQTEQVDRTVFQALLAALVLGVGVMAPVGWFVAPWLLRLVHATAEVRAQALPYLRILFVGGVGMLLFFLFGFALRSAGDAHTPLRLGVVMTLLNLGLNVVLIRGLGPVPALGTAGAALGTAISGLLVSGWAIRLMLSGQLVVHLPRGARWRFDWEVLRELLRFGLPTGLQGIAMNVAGVWLLRYIGSLPASAQAQAAYAVGYTELFSLVTWASFGLRGAAAAVAGQNLGAGHPERSVRGVHTAAGIAVGVATVVAVLFLTIPGRLLGIFGLDDPIVLRLGKQLLGYLSVSGFFIAVALAYTGGLQGTGDTRSPLYISIVSQIAVPLGFCGFVEATRGLHATDIWLAIVLGVASLVVLRRFFGG